MAKRKEKKYKSCVTPADVRRMKRDTKESWKWGKGKKPVLGFN